jgi:hypothetical protein
MVRDYDTQLLESVAVRRRRLRDALLFGALRARRTLDEGLVKAFIGLVIAAVLCAGSVGWSFIQQQRAIQQERERARSGIGTSATGTPTPSPTGHPDWRGKQVTPAMLRDGLRRAGVPDTMFVLPGVQQPRPGVESYYFVAERADKFITGVYERGDERIGIRYDTEDQACRALYDELTGLDPAPVTLSGRQERQARQAVQRVINEVKAQVSPSLKVARTATVAFELPRGLVVDQFGQESGSYLHPDGTPFAQRALPPSVLSTTDQRYPYNYHRYQVAKPFRVRAGLVAPAFEQPGGGIQFKVEPGFITESSNLVTIRWLLREGYLKRVTGVRR